MSVIKEEPEVIAAPNHADFCVYLPWACLQFGVPAIVTISKIIEGGLHRLHSETSKISRSRKFSSSFNLPSFDAEKTGKDKKNPKIYITAVFNNSNKLTELRFEDKNLSIPRQVMKVIRLIIHKQTDLKRLEFNGGLDKYIVYEIGEILKVSHLTDICLDNSFVKEGNYTVLLETSKLNCLSLSKCKINDEVIKEMSKNLEHPKPASKSLVALILSTNMISDDGAKYLAEALRSNRKLAYINLADNRITDDGARYILDTLIEFHVTKEELTAARGRRFAYLKERNAALVEKEQRPESGDDKKSIKGRLSLSSVSPRKGKMSRATVKSLDSSRASVSTVGHDQDRTGRRIENVTEDFQDPFHFPNIYIKEGTAHCKGNNTLLYLNIAYNDLSYLSLKKILDVLIHQKISDIGKGLLDVKIDGNYLPVDCEEMQELDVLLYQKMSSDELSVQRAGQNKKRRQKPTKQRRDTD